MFYVAKNIFIVSKNLILQNIYIITKLSFLKKVKRDAKCTHSSKKKLLYLFQYK